MSYLVPALGIVVLPVLVLIPWYLLHAASFLWCLDQVVDRLPGPGSYPRKWRRIATAVKLAHDGRVPRLLKVHRGKHADRLTISLLTGQTPADVQKARDALAHAYRVRYCHVTSDRPGVVNIELSRRDSLREVVRPAPLRPFTNVAELLTLRIGRCADGAGWLLNILDTHVLIAGSTGSGKGSVLWGIVRALQPAVRSGYVYLWGIDPKGGMELGYAAGLFQRLAYGDDKAMLAMLETLVAGMRKRQAELVGQTRLFRPSEGNPIHVIVVDELAALPAYGDNETRKKASALLQLLLSQGRAVGFVVIAALQDPSKRVVEFRDLFPTRIALRLASRVLVDMVLGEGAHEAGARCERISHSTPGVGYVWTEGASEPTRVRAAHITDADLHELIDSTRRGDLVTAGAPAAEQDYRQKEN